MIWHYECRAIKKASYWCWPLCFQGNQTAKKITNNAADFF
ncbi:hypothetical protein O59_003509 [Cellvibrio sp. BR]|nr:hypothetical protein O59_003509 [Cellvibrio sp. BR]